MTPTPTVIQLERWLRRRFIEDWADRIVVQTKPDDAYINSQIEKICRHFGLHDWTVRGQMLYGDAWTPVTESERDYYLDKLASGDTITVGQVTRLLEHLSLLDLEP